MKLSSLLKNIEVKNTWADCEVRDVTADSRRVQQGDVFVCIKGATFDGHNLAQAALQDGAVAVVAERDLGLEKQILVESTRMAYSAICANYFGNPADKLKLVGLTGTNGKTTTTFLIKQILESLGKKVGLVGTVQNMVGDEIFPAHYTTPDPHELQSLFRRMVDAQCEYCVMEVSSQALAQGRVAGVHFALAVFTNLTQDHLDYHKTWENYFAAKRMLFEQADTALINQDDINGPAMVQGLPCTVKTYGVNENADFKASNVRFSPNGVSYQLECGDTVQVECPIPGRFSVYNSLCAAAAAITLGFAPAEVVRGVAASIGVKGRIEVVPTDTEYTVIIDYAHSPDGLENIISSLKEIATGRVVTLFGCGGDRDKTKRPKMGKIACDLSDFCIVTSDNPRSEDAQEIINDILVGMQGTKTPYQVVVNRRDAIEWALTHAQKDDIILLAGKGHETYQILPEGTIHFDEREVIADILNQQ